MLVRHARVVLATTFVVCAAALLIYVKLTEPRILVLHSYDAEYTWTRDINTGLQRVFDPLLRYRVHWYYMDVKNHPYEEFKRKAKANALTAIRQFNPDLIIAVDDDAQEVVRVALKEKRLPIVHAGINGDIDAYGYDKMANTTGILERKPVADLRDALAAARKAGHQLGTRLWHLGDGSATVETDARQIEALDWAPFDLKGSTMVDTFDDWKAVVGLAQEKADILFVSNYHSVFKDVSKTEIVPPEEVMSWTEKNSKIPVVGIGGFFVEQGGMLAIAASGFEQGETAAHMALRILGEGVEPGSIPVVEPRQFLVYMRRAVLEKRQVSVPAVYESFARATNGYFSS